MKEFRNFVPFQLLHYEIILYFILYVWKALALDAWHDLCILYSADQELYHDACQYLANVELRELDL